MHFNLTLVNFQPSWKDCSCTKLLDGKTGYENNSCLLLLPPRWSKCLAKLSLVEVQLLESCRLWCFLSYSSYWRRSMNLTHDSRRKKRIPPLKPKMWPAVNRAFFHLRHQHRCKSRVVTHQAQRNSKFQRTLEANEALWIPSLSRNFKQQRYWPRVECRSFRNTAALRV